MRRGSTFNLFVILILFALLVFLGYYLYTIYPRESVNLEIVSNSGKNTSLDSGISNQFYPSMRFLDEIITYSISPDCSSETKTSVIRAFQILEFNTVLKFVPADSAEILIFCSEADAPLVDGDYYIAGEGGPSNIVNTGIYHLIKHSKIYLYKEDVCEEPKVALHEILHALGFDHNDNPNSLMYPTLECDQILGGQITEDIDKLYAIPASPELLISSVNASKSGRYLNFNIQIANQGLKDLKDVNLRVVYGDGASEFNIGQIIVGSVRSLDVEYLQVPLSTKKVTFIIDPDNKVNELFEDNNEVVLEVG